MLDCLKIVLHLSPQNLKPRSSSEDRVRFGLIALLFDRPTVSLFLITLHNPTDGHDSFCHSSPTQRLSLPFCPVNWLALNLSVKMGIAPRLSSQNGFEIREITPGALTLSAMPCTLVTTCRCPHPPHSFPHSACDVTGTEHTGSLQIAVCKKRWGQENSGVYLLADLQMSWLI